MKTKEKMKMRGYLIDDSLYKEFQEVCEDTCAIPSRVIRKSIEDYIRDNSKYNKLKKN